MKHLFAFKFKHLIYAHIRHDRIWCIQSYIIFIIVQINVYLMRWYPSLWDSMKRACFSFFEILSRLDGEVQASIRKTFWSNLIISSFLFFLVFSAFWYKCLLTYSEVPGFADIWSTYGMLCSWRMFAWTFWTWFEGIVPSFSSENPQRHLHWSLGWIPPHSVQNHLDFKLAQLHQIPLW